MVDFTEHPENQLFHILPFGHNEINDQHHVMIPEFEDEGQLLVGISQVTLPEVVSVYFQMENNSGNVDKSIDDTNRITWHYLEHNHWVNFKDSEIIENTTNGFTNSGYIKFNLPKGAVSSHTILNGELAWIRGSVSTDSDAYPSLISIKTQAIEAIFTDNGNDVSHRNMHFRPDLSQNSRNGSTASKK